MKYTKNALNVLTAKSYKGIGNAWIVKNLKGNESVEFIVSILNKTIKGEPTNAEEFEQLRNNFESKLVKKFIDCCDGFVAWGDPDFPQFRGVVKESAQPVFLYYKGDINLLGSHNRNISVIGLLNPIGSIEERERKIVHELVKNGGTIVSGLALGCDSIAHLQALDSNGKTVAILPSPLNNILPARNIGLAYQIVEEGGLLVTEYGNDYKSQMELSSRYLERDRLQALYCDSIILAASYATNSAEIWGLFGQKLDCGARHAMGHASEYGIPCAVMYDEVLDQDNPMFDLNRKILGQFTDTTIISENNLIEMVEKIMSLKPKSDNSDFQYSIPLED
jgi:DNA processing protein